MNIRERIIETTVAGYYTESWTEGTLLRKKVKVWVPTRYESVSRLEYLNPETTKWEALPKIYEYKNIEAPKSN